MKKLIWYYPSDSFSGYVSDHQSEISNVLNIKSSSKYDDLEVHRPELAFDYSNDDYPAATKEDDNKWLNFSLKSGYFIITHYELQQRADSQKDFMKKWTFEGSNDATNWVSLDVSETDSSFGKLEGVKLCACKYGVFRHFSLRELEQKLLAVHRIEIYGTFCATKAVCHKLLLLLRTKKQIFHGAIPQSFFLLIFLY